MERRLWEYHFARVQHGQDLAVGGNATLTELGFNEWEAYAAQPDPESPGDWIIFLKREVDEETARPATPRT
jgi:hypothetical protein